VFQDGGELIAAQVGHHRHVDLGEVGGQAREGVGREHLPPPAAREHRASALRGRRQHDSVEVVELLTVEGGRLGLDDGTAVDAAVGDVHRGGALDLDSAHVESLVRQDHPGDRARLAAEGPADQWCAPQRSQHASHPHALAPGVQMDVVSARRHALDGDREQGRGREHGDGRGH
jgi:hypothetical protein